MIGRAESFRCAARSRRWRRSPSGLWRPWRCVSSWVARGSRDILC